MTRKDVAARAGVSVAVVSYVLNDTKKLPDATREKVLKAVEELGYKPNLAARALKTKRTQQIAVLLNGLDNPFEAAVLSDIEAAARTAGLTVAIFTFLPDREEQIKEALTGRIDGVILLGQSLQDTTVSHFHSMNIPLFSIHKPVWDRKGVGYIDLDWVDAMRRLIRRFRDAGRSSIGFMSNGLLSHHHTQRFQAFLQAMQVEKTFFRHDLVLYGGGEYGKAYRVMTEAIGKGLDFSAIICANDMMALGVLSACRDQGVAVPEKLAVAGCEDTLAGELFSPSLTSIRFPREQLGALAVLLLQQEMAGRDAGGVLLEGELKERESG